VLWLQLQNVYVRKHSGVPASGDRKAGPMMLGINFYGP